MILAFGQFSLQPDKIPAATKPTQNCEAAANGINFDKYNTGMSTPRFEAAKGQTFPNFAGKLTMSLLSASIYFFFNQVA